MKYKIDQPIFTRVIDDVSSFLPLANSLYLTGTSVEERSEHLVAWEDDCEDVQFCRITDADRATISLSDLGPLSLRSQSQIADALATVAQGTIYLDITGLPHHVWAPLLRALRQLSHPTFVVYVEPEDYRFHPSPTESTIFDLSERIEGIAPIPGFARLASKSGEEALFVPLLGFEGARFAFLLEDVQPEYTNIFPVVGVPGFRPEYPFFTYLGNRLQLQSTRAWTNVRFARANCPFSLYQVLQGMAEKRPGRRMKVAPIGTKPHALGAVLYALDFPQGVELVYDHPVRKAQRTSGTGRVCLYDLGLLPPLRPHRSMSRGVGEERRRVDASR